MQDFSLDIVAKKSVRGIFALVSRTFILQILSIATSFILTIFLEPSVFGIFFVVSSVIVFLNYFQDIGLAASLIQKKEELTTEELRTTFTVQQILVLLLIVPAFIFSKNITQFYNLDTNGLLLFYALLISFFMSSLKTIPTVIIERNLDFNKLVISQISENIVYNLALIVFAISGFGIMSFGIAVLSRSLVGLIVIYIVAPWNIGFSFDLKVFRKLMSFGLPLQVNSILAFVKDDLLNIYLGKILPFRELGYVGFSQKWAFMPIRLVMDNAIKVTFPSFSRLQHDKDALKVAIEKSLFLVSFVIFPSVFGIILLSPYFINLVPRYQKWEPAIVSLVFFSLSTFFSSISTPLTNFLNAIGKVKITLYFMIFWTAATWVFTFFFIKFFGFNGVAAASFSVSISSVFVIIVAKKYVSFSLFRPIFRQFVAALLTAVFIFFTQRIVTNLPFLFLEILLAGSFYIVIVVLIAKEELLKTGRFIIGSIRREK